MVARGTLVRPDASVEAAIDASAAPSFRPANDDESLETRGSLARTAAISLDRVRGTTCSLDGRDAGYSPDGSRVGTSGVGANSSAARVAAVSAGYSPDGTRTVGRSLDDVRDTTGCSPDGDRSAGISLDGERGAARDTTCSLVAARGIVGSPPESRRAGGTGGGELDGP